MQTARIAVRFPPGDDSAVSMATGGQFLRADERDGGRGWNATTRRAGPSDPGWESVVESATGTGRRSGQEVDRWRRSQQKRNAAAGGAGGRVTQLRGRSALGDGRAELADRLRVSRLEDEVQHDADDHPDADGDRRVVVRLGKRCEVEPDHRDRDAAKR